MIVGRGPSLEPGQHLFNRFYPSGFRQLIHSDMRVTAQEMISGERDYENIF
jgi:hypothetical protein